MNPRRFDLFGPAHKALRKAFYELAMRAGTADLTNEIEASLFGDDLKRAVAYKRLHVRVVDKHLHPAIERKVPGTTARFAMEYSEAIEQLNAIEGLFTAIMQSAADQARVRALGLAVYRALNAFIASQHAHYRHEEETFNPLLWAHYKDEDLAEIQQKIIASYKPGEATLAASLLIPALNPREREGMLLGLAAAEDSSLYETACQLAERCLDPRDWAALRARLAAAKTTADD